MNFPRILKTAIGCVLAGILLAARVDPAAAMPASSHLATEAGGVIAVGWRGHGYAVSHGDRERALIAREIVTVGSDMLVEDAAKLLAYHNISGMPVEDPDGKVVAIVSEADVIGHIRAIVSDVMTEGVISVGEEATVEQIATLLAEHRIKRVPVMADGSIRGMVSRSDIVRAIAARS